MIDLNKIVTYRDGWTLERGTVDVTEGVMGSAGRVCDLGRHFGLSLDRFEVDSKMIYFEWCGTKRNLLRFYTHCSKRLYKESLEERKRVQLRILNK